MTLHKVHLSMDVQLSIEKTIYEYETAREFIRSVIDRLARNRKSPLSLRGFSFHTGVPVSSLSAYLGVKERVLAIEHFLKIAIYVGLNENQLDYFLSLCVVELSPQKSEEEKYLKRHLQWTAERKIKRSAFIAQLVLKYEPVVIAHYQDIERLAFRSLIRFRSKETGAISEHIFLDRFLALDYGAEAHNYLIKQNDGSYEMIIFTGSTGEDRPAFSVDRENKKLKVSFDSKGYPRIDGCVLPELHSKNLLATIVSYSEQKVEIDSQNISGVKFRFYNRI